jgi:hypothetical protein
MILKYLLAYLIAELGTIFVASAFANAGAAIVTGGILLGVGLGVAGVTQTMWDKDEIKNEICETVSVKIDDAI